MSMNAYIDNLQVYNHLHLLQADATVMKHDAKQYCKKSRPCAHVKLASAKSEKFN